MNERKNVGYDDAKKVKVRLATRQGSFVQYNTRSKRAARIRLTARPARELKAYVAICDEKIIIGHPS